LAVERRREIANLSIATKLYLIFALLATVTVALASITVISARKTR